MSSCPACDERLFQKLLKAGHPADCAEAMAYDGEQCSCGLGEKTQVQSSCCINDVRPAVVAAA